MAAVITLKQLTTADNGEVLSNTDFNAVNRDDIDIEQTVGDEFYLKNGDLTLRSATLLDLFPASNNAWIALYVNGQLTDVFGERTSEEYNYKTGIYTYRLKSIQQIFYEKLKSTLVKYSAITTEWNYNLGASDLTIYVIPSGLIFDRYGFSLFDMIASKSGQHNSYGFQIGTVVHPGPVMNENDLPILFRGDSFSIGLSLQTALNGTFWEDGSNIYHVTWWDLYQLAIFGFNSFVRITPAIVNSGGTDYLKTHIDIIPKINQPVGTPISVLSFAERKKIFEKHKIDGVILSGSNFTFELGVSEGDNVFSRSVDIYNYLGSTIATALYWSAGDYNSGTGKYELSGPYFDSGLVDGYYNGMITAGHGIDAQAKFVYNDGSEKILKLLDQVTFGSPATVFHINRIKYNGKSDLADVEGIIIDE